VHADEAPWSQIAALLELGDLITPFALKVAGSLGLADCFDEDRAMTIEELVPMLSVERASLERLLRSLEVAGLVCERVSGGYVLTDLGSVMRSDHPLSMRDACSLAPLEVDAWIWLEHCVRTTESGFFRAHGESHRSFRARNLDEDVRMDRIHQAATRLELLTLARAYPWRDTPRVVDVGGGTGTFLAGLLARFRDMQGTLFDLPRMLVNAAPVLARYGVAGRCKLVGGDFFEAIPTDGDLYVLKAVLGGWDDAACLHLLGVVRRALRPENRVLIIEPVMGIGRAFGRANILQLHTFVLYGGKVRTLGDYRALADAADMQVQRVIIRPTLSMIELGLRTASP
jgi:SAM-dependent methyltransferase/DNA-binding transcriptional ArsR family regulator